MKTLRKANSLAILASLTILSMSLLPLFSARAMAQATTGSIRGTVTDQSGATVDKVSVSAKNQATGVQSPIFQTTGEGLYVVPNLTPGKYTIILEQQGFKRTEYTDVEVRLGQDSVINALLQPGGVNEVISVTAANEVLLGRDSSQVSASIDARKVRELPMNLAGAGIDSLALLVPGVTPGFGTRLQNTVLLSINGSRSRSIGFNIDGQDNNDQSVEGLLYSINNQDLVADYQVLTNNFSAQYGRNAAGIINIITKSGTNQLHGTAFWFHRDQRLLDSRTNLEANSGLPTPPQLDNVFGTTIGGPIIEGKAFFFGSYQGITQRTENILFQSFGLAILPDELQRLKQSFPGNAAIATIADFGAFATHKLGVARPQAGTFDTVTIGGKTFRAASPEFTLRQPVNEQEFTLRGDMKATRKDNYWARYLFQNRVHENDIATPNGFAGDFRVRTHNVGGSWDHQLSNYSVNSFKFSYSRFHRSTGGGCEGVVGCIEDPLSGNSLATLHLSNIVSDKRKVSLNDVGPITPFIPFAHLEEVFQFSDSLLLIKGKHQMMYGADIRRLRTKEQFLQEANGTFSFSSSTKLATNTPDSVILTLAESPNKWFETNQYYYFQDDWRLRENLTLNLGVRYEYATQPLNRLHDLTVERESNPTTAFWKQNVPVEDRTVPIVPTDKNNFAPRIGFAYTPHFWKRFFGQDSSVIRGGYAITYDPPFYNLYANVAQTAPAAFDAIIINGRFPVPGPVPTRDAVRAFAILNDVVGRNRSDPLTFPGRFVRTKVSPDFHSPLLHQWSVGIQRQIGNTHIIEARYLGTRGESLFQGVPTNPFIQTLAKGFSSNVVTGVAANGDRIVKTINFPGFPSLIPSGVTVNENGRIHDGGSELTYQNSAESTYHSLQARYDGRLFNQLIMGGAYTLSKARDNASEVFAFFESPYPQNPFDPVGGNLSYSGFDHRHTLSLHGIWDVPFLSDQRGAVGHILGGWQVNGVYLISSGFRTTPRQLRANSYLDSFNSVRPFTGNPNADPRTVGITDVDAALFGFGPFLRTNQGVFAQFIPSPTGFYSLTKLFLTGKLVPVSRNDVRFIYNGPQADQIFGTPLGDVKRNSLIGPKINNLNASLVKNTRLGERLTFQLRADVFNVLNHPNPGFGSTPLVSGRTPDNLLDSGNFNQRDQIGFGRRVVQLGLRIMY